MVRLFRLEKMYERNQKRLVVCLTDKTMEDGIFQALAALGHKEWHGPRAPGWLATEAQKWFDNA